MEFVFVFVCLFVLCWVALLVVSHSVEMWES